MDILKNKIYENYEYLSRYSSTPHYFNTVDEREIFGIGANMVKNLEYVSHEVKQSDTLDYLALKYYNNPTYWWVIAYFNDIQDSFIHLADKYRILRIPNISGIKFEDAR